VPIAFQLLRDVLTKLALPPELQRQVLAGTVVTDELALDLDNAVGSLNYEMDRTGITLTSTILTDLRRLNEALTAPPADVLWDDASLDRHPVWAAARQTASALLTQLPPQTIEQDFRDTP